MMNPMMMMMMMASQAVASAPPARPFAPRCVPPGRFRDGPLSNGGTLQDVRASSWAGACCPLLSDFSDFPSPAAHGHTAWPAAACRCLPLPAYRLPANGLPACQVLTLQVPGCLPTSLRLRRLSFVTPMCVIMLCRAVPCHAMLEQDRTG